MSVVNHSSRLPGAYAKAVTQTGREGINGAIARAQRRADSTGKNVVVYGRRPGSGKRKWDYGMDAQVTPDRRNPRKSNPTKAQKKEKARKASVQRRVAVALAKFLKQANPAGKYAGATMRRNKGGSITIVPIKMKANAASGGGWMVDAFHGGGAVFRSKKDATDYAKRLREANRQAGNAGPVRVMKVGGR